MTSPVNHNIVDFNKDENELMELLGNNCNQVLDNLGVGILVINKNMEIVALNKHLKKWYPQIDITKKPICYKMLPIEATEQICKNCPVVKSLEDGNIYEVIMERCINVGIRNTRHISSPLTDKVGKVLGAVQVIEDVTETKRWEEAVNREITERKQAEEKIRQLNKDLEKQVQERTQELVIAYEKLELKNKDLVSANNRVNNILESITDAFFALDRDWRFTYLNSEAEKIFNHKKEDILGRKIYDVLPKSILSTYDNEYKSVFENKIDTQFEAYYEPTSQWFEVRAYPAQDGLSIFYKDITKRKQDEELLKKSRDFYLTIFEELPVLIWRSNLDAKFDYYNKRWLEFTGMSFNQVPENAWINNVHPEDLDYVSKTYYDSFDARVPYEIIYRLRRFDQEYRWVIESGRPFDNLNGNFAGYLGFCYDITEQKLTEEALKKSEERYRSLIEQSLEGIFVFDPTTREILEVNQQMSNLLGYTEQEFKGMYYDEIVIGDFISISRNIDRTLQGDITCINREYKRKDGAMINVEALATLISYGKSKVCLVHVRDVTERKKAEEKLNKSYQNLKLSLDETVNALVTVSEKRDPYTAGHQQRVAELACAIAKEMKLPKQQIEGISIAGKLHDIGKIYVPTDILNKPGKLSELEMGIVKTHSEVSQDILSKIPFERPVAEMVAQHHERIDGSGYPKGLAGEEILLEAKILAVADVLEAMASHRPYRPAVGLQKALEELEQNKGRFYDPVVVNACLTLIDTKGFAFTERA